MIYEKADLGDTGALTELRIAYLKEDYGDIAEETLNHIAGKLPGYFREHLNKDLYAFVCRDETIAGCCLLCVSEKPPNPSFINGKTGTVMNVYVKPQFRRKGIASALMKMLIAESEKLGLDLVELKATDAGYRLYRSLGFEDAVSEYHNMKLIINRRSASR